MSKGVIAQGRSALSARAAGSRMSSLFLSDPLAIRAMIGSSRSGVKPVT